MGLSTLGVFGRLDFQITQPLYTFGKLSSLKQAASSEVTARNFGITGREGMDRYKVVATFAEESL